MVFCSGQDVKKIVGCIDMSDKKEYGIFLSLVIILRIDE